MITYLFFRESGFYPIDLDDDFSAREGARINPGTIRVENAETKQVVWESPPSAGVTPRTDAEYEEADTCCASTNKERFEAMTAFARGLERELSALRASFAVAQHDARLMFDKAQELTKERDELKSKLATIYHDND